MCGEGGGLGRSPREASGLGGGVGGVLKARNTGSRADLQATYTALGGGGAGEQGEREGLSSFVENTNP